MPKFIVTKCLDAFANYVAIVEAADRREARRIAEDDHDSLEWKEDGTTEFDAIEFDNVAPEPVADDFAFGESESARMRAALEAAEHWLAEEAASKEPGSTKPDEILRVIREALGTVPA